MTSTTTLLVDFGASRIKSAAWCCKEEKIIAVKECAAPTPNFGADGAVEISPEDYWIAFEKTAGEILREYQEIDSLWLCTEMHGVMLIDVDSDKPLTSYISWRDERASRSSTLSDLQKISEDFFAQSAMRLRCGLPFITLAHLKKIHKLPSAFRFLTLADWLLWRGGEKDPAIHASLAAGTGLFSVKEKNWSANLAKMAGLDYQKIIFPKVVEAGQKIGEINIAERKVKVFGGIGDLQAAAHGAGFPALAKLLINLGTGSQVIGCMNNPSEKLEIRLGVKGENFSAITHIPSGRALNVFANFFDSCSVRGDEDSAFWNIFSSLSSEEVLNAELNVDLAVFEAAWNYKNGGSISGIMEGKFSARGLIAAIAKSWLKQYAQAIAEIDLENESTSFLLAGGLSRRGKFILPVLEILTKRKGIMAQTKTGEETLDGLLALS